MWLQSPVSGKNDSEFVTIKSASQSDFSERLADVSSPAAKRNRNVAALIVRPSEIMESQGAAVQLTSE